MRIPLLIVAATVSCSKSDPPSSAAATPMPMPAESAMSTPADASHATPIERRLFPSHVEASSFLGSEIAPFVLYHPSYVADGDPKTAWNEGGPTDGAGESLRVPFTAQHGVHRLRLRILDGFHFSKRIYAANSRAKTIQVRVIPSGKLHRFTLEDRMEWQEIAFDERAEVVDAIELEVVDVYPGVTYKDLAISEIEIYATSEAPEVPDLEQRNLATLQAWAKRQREIAALQKAAPVISFRALPRAPNLELPKEVSTYLDRANHLLEGEALFGGRPAAGSRAIDIAAIAACFEDGLTIPCLGPLYTSAGIAVAPISGETPPCGPPTLFSSGEQDGPIRELAVETCEQLERLGDDRSGQGPKYDRYETVVFEYDEMGRVRLIARRHQLAFVYLEWGIRNDRWQIVGGVSRNRLGEFYVLAPE